MIPILYESTETSFSTNGLGRLADCISCYVEEQRNGTYECVFEYPVTGQNYSLVKEGRIVAVTHDETGDVQPFVLYRREANLDGHVTFYAQHISYMLSSIIVQPFTAGGIAEALADIVPNSLPTNVFTFWTDKVVTGQFELTVPRTVRSLLCGEEGSLLDVFGTGEYEWDKWTVKLHLNRGQDSGVTIRYGKNLKDLTQSIDASGVYNAVAPYWTDGETVVNLDHLVTISGVTDVKAIPLDLSAEFDEAPTTTELEEMATTRLNNATGTSVTENITVDFVQLWQTEEYANYAPLQRVGLCDTVTVIYQDLGVYSAQKVIRTEWDVLMERYSEMELGESQMSLSDVITEIVSRSTSDLPSTSMMATAIANATNKITGNNGGYVVLHTDADGTPYELLVMDTADINTAVNVWRWNLGGLGFSSTGYSGEYASLALTMDGQINADLITTGLMSANRIQGGVLTLGGENNGSGVLELRTEDGTLVGKMDKDGLRMYGQTGYVSMNYTDGFAGYDLDGNKLYWVASDEFHMEKAVVETEITLCDQIRFIEITNTDNTGVAIVAVGG